MTSTEKYTSGVDTGVAAGTENDASRRFRPQCVPGVTMSTFCRLKCVPSCFILLVLAVLSVKDIIFHQDVYPGVRMHFTPPDRGSPGNRRHCKQRRWHFLNTRTADRLETDYCEERPNIPEELRRTRWGCRVGMQQRMKKRRFNPCIPVIVTGNVRSLANKMDELEALAKTQREYKECSMIPDSNVTIPGFLTVCVDRDNTASCKKKG